MADYYTQFSTQLEDVTEDEFNWFKDLFEAVEDSSDYNLSEEADQDVFDERYGEGMSELYHSIMHDLEDVLGFKYKLDEKEGTAWFSHDESGDGDQLARILQHFLKKFRPTETHTFSWASTCSKPRLDGFGGGMILVTSDFIYCQPDHMIMGEMAAKFTRLKEDDPKRTIESHEC